MGYEDDAVITFGLLVRQRRQELNMTQEELAHRAKLHRTYIGDIERGTRNVAFKNLVRLCMALHVHPADFLRDLRWPSRYAK
ncbi:MAG: XRE family transcriptional regulator [Planctomycetaceae bacterium]|nr:MAG: XRE family transcriptional regulator [Planctomycetaceae bacterium]